MRRFLRENSLGLAFGTLFLGTLVAQALVGHADFNADQAAHHGDPIGLWRYVTSSSFGVDVLENWQSEYLQFTLYIVGTVWLLSWLGQSITGRVAYNAEQFDHQQAALSWVQYVVTPDFWNRTLQNWQSEFLAIGSMAVLAIYLRQRGSPESKPVGAPHSATGTEG